MPAALLVLLAVSGCSGGVLDPQGPIGAANAKILLNALGIMLVIVVPTIIAILAFGWWFRASNTRARYRRRLLLMLALQWKQAAQEVSKDAASADADG
jgi:heme/copper-type cytochrome/quinol oxidase subunit 2